MLVLSRNSGEQVVIGDGIVVTVTEVSGGRVSIGIEAPQTISIRRDELVVDQDVAAFRSLWLEVDREQAPAS